MGSFASRKLVPPGRRPPHYRAEPLERRVLLATFMVTNPNDSGPGSLRQAILDANASGPVDNIHFNIEQPGVQTIVVNSPLPEVVDDAIIDGYTQDGASVNTVPIGSNAVLLIELRAGAGARAGAGLRLGQGETTVKGLVINNFAVGISLEGFGEHTVRGNYIGTNADGTAAVSNAIGIRVASSRNVIGGGLADRNLISGNTDVLAVSSGVFIELGFFNVVQGNYIGTNRQGETALGNKVGVRVGRANENTIDRNVISGNLGDGVHIAGGQDNVVTDNLIGLEADGVAALGNIGDGVHVTSTQDSAGRRNVIGGATSLSDANTIAFNRVGVAVSEAASRQNPIRGNSIYDNIRLGIDLVGGEETPAGVTENDEDNLDADPGPNGLQNYPVFTQAHLTPGGFQVQVKGVLISRPGRPFKIDLYANPAPDPSGHGEGKTYLRAVDVMTDGTGRAEFDVTIAAPPGRFLSATATDADAIDGGDTSEFSECVPVIDPTSIPTFTGAGGGGSGSVQPVIHWLNNDPPQPGETAYFPPGTQPVVDVGFTVREVIGLGSSIQVTSVGALTATESYISNLFVNGGNALFNNPGPHVVTFIQLRAGGTVGGTGPLDADTIDGQAGGLTGGAPLKTGAMVIFGSNNVGRQVTVTRETNIGGAVNFLGGGGLGLGNGAVGTITAPTVMAGHGTSSGFTLDGGATLFVNNNLTARLFSSPMTVNIGAGASVEVAQGVTMSLESGGGTAGAINLNDPSSLLVLTALGTFALNQTWGITGPGTARLQNGAALQANTAGAINANFQMTGGAMTGTQNIRFAPPVGSSGPGVRSAVTAGGTPPVTVDWTGGTMSGTGKVIIAPDAVLNIAGASPHNLGRTLDVEGQANWTSGPLNFTGGTLNVMDGGSFTADAAVTVTATGGTGGGNFNVLPGGNFSKRGGGTARFTPGSGGLNFNNSSPASVVVESGTLALGGGGTNTGHFDVRAPGVLQLEGPNPSAFAAGWSIVGDGTVNMAGGTHSFATGTIASPLTVNLGANTVLSGAGDLTVAGTLNWTGGQMAGVGKTALPAGSILNITGSIHNLHRRLDVGGTAHWTAGGITTNNGTLTVLAGGTFNATTAGTLTASGNGGANAVNNAGTFNKGGAGTVELVAGSSGLPFSNTGTVNVNQGTLSPLSSVLQYNAATNTLAGGTWNVFANATLNFAGGSSIRTNAGNVTLSGSGSGFPAINALTTNNGTFTLAAGRDFAANPVGGTLTNNGTIDLASDSALSVAGAYVNGTAGTLATDLGGDAVGTFGQVAATGAVTLNGGTLAAALVGGFDPGLDVVVPVLTGASRTGQFNSLSAAPTPSGRALRVAYDASRALIAVGGAVAGRHVFYNNSFFDGNSPNATALDDGAVAPNKSALLPGQAATEANYTDYSRGINGVMVDIGALGAADPTAVDFAFRVGNDDNPAGWAVLTPAQQPAVTVRRGDGVSGTDRVTLTWPDNTIRATWLQVTVRATAATGLAAPDVFYYGNLPGDTFNSAAGAPFFVNSLDVQRTRINQFQQATITSPFDHDKSNNIVNSIDVQLSRINQFTTLNRITVPAAAAQRSMAAAAPLLARLSSLPGLLSEISALKSQRKDRHPDPLPDYRQRG